MKRKAIIIFAIFAFIVAFNNPAMAAQVYIDGQKLDVATASESGTTLVPLRAIFQALGATVDWDGSTQTVTATKSQTTVKLQIGDKTAYKNGQPVTLQVPGKVVSGNTMVPLRFVSEALGADVDWDGSTQTITIISVGTTGSAPSPPISTAGLTKVHFIDVGQADAIYIELPGNGDIVIDAGNKADGSLIVNYLNRQKVDDIELLIATHSHEDHIGGMPAVFDAFAVEKVLDTGYCSGTDTCKAYKAKVLAEGALYMADNRQSFSFGSVTLHVLTGPETWSSDTNNYSVVCLLDTGEIEFLFTGDAEAMAEGSLLALSSIFKAEILKVGHHGSNTSTSELFLERVNPEIAVISVGAGNSYGHPADETIQRIQYAGIDIYRTDLHGTVIVTTDGKTYSVVTEQKVDPVSQVKQPEPKSQPAPAPVTSGQYVGSSKSDKYHYPSCRYGQSILPHNLLWFKDAADARAHGYVPCGVCKP